jgi:hypothetical protein
MMCRGEMSAVCGSWQKRVSTHGVSFASRDMPGSYACSLLYLSATDQTSFLAYNHVRISSLVFAVSHDWRYREGSWALEVWQKRVSTRGGFLACKRHAGSCACSPSLCQPFTCPSLFYLQLINRIREHRDRWSWISFPDLSCLIATYITLLCLNWSIHGFSFQQYARQLIVQNTAYTRSSIALDFQRLGFIFSSPEG